MAALLRRGAMTPDEIAEEIEADVDSVKRSARRHKTQLQVLQGGRLGLFDKRAS